MSTKQDPEDKLSALFDTEGLSREDIAEELVVHSIELAPAEARFRSMLDKLEKRKRLDDARREREAWAPPMVWTEFKSWVATRATEEIVAAIRGLEGALAHRDFSEWTREALETHLFDLETLKRRAQDDDGR